MVRFGAPFEYVVSGKWLELLKEIAPMSQTVLGECILTRQPDCNAEQGLSQFISNSLLQSRSHAPMARRYLGVSDFVNARWINPSQLDILEN
jgi:hypothetical protein